MAAPFCPVAFCILILGPATLGAGSPPAISVSGAQERSTSEWLADLAHQEAGVRLAARKWLVRNLEGTDWPALAEVAGGGDFAARRALAQVLADHPRHFGLAARLTTHPDSGVAEVGDWALRESALAWNPSLVEEPLSLEDFPDAWRAAGGREDVLEANPSAPDPGGLTVALDRLHRFGDAPVDLILDPGLDARRRLRTPIQGGVEPLVGSWDHLLIQLVRQHRVTLQVIGWRPEPLEGFASDDMRTPDAFVRVCARGEAAGRESGSALLSRWVRGAAQDSDPGRRVACANALAQVGWPAAIAWLGQRWLMGDTDFFEAVCIGAARRHLAPGLLAPIGARTLLKQGSAAVTSVGGRDWNRVHLAGLALRELPDVLSDGTPLGDVLMEEGAGGGEGDWLRFFAYSGRFRVHTGLAARALESLRRLEGPAALRRVALAAFVSSGGSQVGPLGNLAAMAKGLEAGAVEAWVRDLELAGVWPDKDSDFEALQAQENGLGRFAFWWFVVGANERAEAAALRAAGEARAWDPWVAALAVPLARGRRQQVMAWVARLTELRPELGQRLALRLSLLEAKQAFERLETILAKTARSSPEWMDLAYLAPMDVVGARARGALIGGLESDPMPAGLGAALEQAQFNLRSSGSFLLAEEFGADLRRKAVRGSHPLTDRILEEGWAGRSLQGEPSSAGQPLGTNEERPPR